MTFLVPGFMGSAVESGIKYQGRLDLGLIVSAVPAALAGVFTRNEVKAAPVLVGIDRIREGGPYARGIIANSGNANACTGTEGVAHVHEICALVAKELDIDPGDIMVSSTGVIGEPLPIDRIKKAIPRLIGGLSEEALVSVADAILTTDTVSKTAVRHLDISGIDVTVAGMAKGAGMIGPNMGLPRATMLSFILSDAKIDPTWWQLIVGEAVSKSFNRIVIDGDTSTNDTLLALANGLAGNPIIDGNRHGQAFRAVIEDLVQDLAHQLVRDGEGVTKCVTIRVKGARNRSEADKIARTIAKSPLVKTAFFGEDPNWGRVLAASGRAGLHIDQGLIELFFNDVKVVEGGIGMGKEAEERAKEAMAAEEFSITLDLGLGKGEAQVLASDLSIDYVRINADYRS
ncbi:MAG: bifunctional glutamate N-acetyltransferase/amino-acid acetyltransferase ArgJ [Nitrospiraceae bacterium]|nr:bifunctional glutamate N-acetyltransferase/amino-acid acetyltransferase ArgJ [Nitrospiraceae bacterium]